MGHLGTSRRLNIHRITLFLRQGGGGNHPGGANKFFSASRENLPSPGLIPVYAPEALIHNFLTFFRKNVFVGIYVLNEKVNK